MQNSLLAKDLLSLSLRIQKDSIVDGCLLTSSELFIQFSIRLLRVSINFVLFHFQASASTHERHGIMPAQPRLPISTINSWEFINMNSIPRCHTIPSIESLELLVSCLLLRAVRNSRSFGLDETPFLNQLASWFANFLKRFQYFWDVVRCSSSLETLC
jgi:hypothetical protein